MATLLKDFVLSNEIANIGNFKINNVSNVIRNYDLVLDEDYIKLGSLVFISKNTTKVPNNFKQILKSETTDLSDYIPYTYFIKLLEYKNSMIKEKYDIVKILGKKFVKFTDIRFKEIILDKTIVKSVISKDELSEDYIDDYIRLSDKRFLVWY